MGYTDVYTCCSKDDGAVGCVTASDHVEDLKLTAILNQFNLTNEQEIQEISQLTEVSDSEEISSEIPEMNKTTEDHRFLTKNGITYYEHVLAEGDTMQGLCLKYNVTKTKFKRANNIINEWGLYSRSTVLIPTESGFQIPGKQVSEDVKYRSDLKRLQSRYGISLQEAKYYLSFCNGDFDAAVKEMEEDILFEHNGM
eukprot:TRINITY_DN2522_c0_g1_i1.p1 TRINITY_DN2522_c0_g1~~TRINITY_DN2522_c0_g1_i1.p1  ORF type:complete len:197 (+),score=54.85 TRINITY_DN2522_c0_g1_i1:284-874(+)